MGIEATRERIVDGAAALFADVGIDEATVQDVLERAGVSRRTFYQYFDSKEQVLAAVYDRWVDGLVRAVASTVDPTADPVSIVVAGLDAWITYQQQTAPTAVRLMAEASRPTSLLHPRREATIDALVATIDAAVRQVVGANVDPLVFRGLVLGAEGLSLHLAEHSRLDAERARLRRVVGASFLVILGHTGELPDPPRS
ncbi:MAG: TetR/AcrR family transcriptional regulator [Myxococcota bacterium]